MLYLSIEMSFLTYPKFTEIFYSFSYNSKFKNKFFREIEVHYLKNPKYRNGNCIRY